MHGHNYSGVDRDGFSFPSQDTACTHHPTQDRAHRVLDESLLKRIRTIVRNTARVASLQIWVWRVPKASQTRFDFLTWEVCHHGGACCYHHTHRHIHSEVLTTWVPGLGNQKRYYVHAPWKKQVIPFLPTVSPSSLFLFLPPLSPLPSPLPIPLPIPPPSWYLKVPDFTLPNCISFQVGRKVHM